jgi:chemotaxis protein CheD
MTGINLESVHKRKTKRVAIHPGEFYVSNKSVVISTLLGSCVSACLYDPVNRIVGMNHFLLSTKRNIENIPICATEAGRYGVHAMELVINGMLKLGAKRENLSAKAFGGGSLYQSHHGPGGFFRVGEINSRFIFEFLKNDGIPLVAYDLGGETGRMIRFSSDDFSVFVRRFKKTVTPALLKKEKEVWLRSIKQEKQKTVEPDLWE